MWMLRGVGSEGVRAGVLQYGVISTDSRGGRGGDFIVKAIAWFSRRNWARGTKGTRE